MQGEPLLLRSAVDVTDHFHEPLFHVAQQGGQMPGQAQHDPVCGRRVARRELVELGPADHEQLRVLQRLSGNAVLAAEHERDRAENLTVPDLLQRLPLLRVD